MLVRGLACLGRIFASLIAWIDSSIHRLLACFACLLAGWLAGWLACLVGWLAGWLVGWLVGCLFACLGLAERQCLMLPAVGLGQVGATLLNSDTLSAIIERDLNSASDASHKKPLQRFGRDGACHLFLARTSAT